ncbi:hypothetical protein M9Y10_002618 [Tritrichomonas musculus]|uniref:MatE family protein n=1 Tax=Tritrichomonas musculus TaxID=1915356 RepID=A0ABR2LAA9_9EUKA
MTNIKSLEEPLNPSNSNDFQGHDVEISKITVDPGEKDISNLSRKGSQVSDAGVNTQKDDEKNNESLVTPNGDTQPRGKLTPEDLRLGGSKPLKTIFKLSVGPLLSQVTNGLYGVITTIWISKACGDDGLSAVSTMNAFDGIGRAFGFFLAIAAATQVSFLYGKGKSKEAGQIIADLIRLSFVCGAIVAAVLLPILKPCARWFGADDHIVDQGFKYMEPLSIFAFNTCIFLAAGGCLQGEGRTFLFGMSNVACLFLNMAVFNPIFLFVFKTGIIGASSATVLSEFIPAITILILFYCHKFGVKPQLNQLLKKFSPNTWPALKVGTSSLIAQLSICVPSIMVRKYIGMACGNDPQEFSDSMAGFNAAIRICNLTHSIFNAISQAFIPAASYAFAAKRYKRYLKLTIHIFWLMLIWGAVTCILTWSIPRTLSKMFSNGEGYLKYAEKMVAYNNGLGPISGVKLNAQSMLQAIQMGPRATMLSFINNFVTIVILVLVLYYTDPHDGARIIWCYPLSHLMSCFISIFFLWGPIKNIFRLSKEEDMEEDYIRREKEMKQVDNSDDKSVESIETDEINNDKKQKSDAEFKDDQLDSNENHEAETDVPEV